MYYAGLTTHSSASGSGQTGEKPSIYVAAPSAYAPAGYAQPGLTPGMAPRYTAAPQAYAVMSNANPNAYTLSPAYHSMPYTTIQGIPASTHPYLSAAQYPGMGFQPAMGPRSVPPSHYPVQAGAPLIAAGYTQMPGALPATRSYQMAAYPPGYPLPAGAAPVPYHVPATFGPPF